MDKFLPTMVIGVVFVVVIVLMVLSWRRRTRRDSGLAPRAVAVEARGAERAAADVFYVATTQHDTPLERLAVAGLGFRGKARLAVWDGGLSLVVTGADEVFIPAADIVEVATATWTIDRVVEQGGLVLLAWRVAVPDGPDESRATVDSYVRIVDQQDRERLMAAIQEISPADHQAGTTTEKDDER